MAEVLEPEIVSVKMEVLVWPQKEAEMLQAQKDLEEPMVPVEEHLRQPITLVVEEAGLAMVPMDPILNFVPADTPHEMVHKEENADASTTVLMAASVVEEAPTTAVVVAVATLVVAVVDGVLCILVEVVVLTMQAPTRAILRVSMMDMVKYLSINCNY